MRAYAARPPAGAGAPGRLAGQALVGAPVALLAVALTWFVNGHNVLVGAAALIAVVGTLWLATTRRTGLALALFMVYIGALDGFLKLSTGSSVVTLIRDVLLYAIVVGLLVRAAVDGRRLPLPPLTAWVVVFVLLVLVQLLNPQNGTVAHSLGGVRQQLEFVPLFFLTYTYVRTKRALRVFVVLLLLLAAANGVANWVQFHLTPQQLAAWGPGYSERVLAQGGFSESGRIFFDPQGHSYVRPFGLGSESGAGGLIAAFALAGVVALASLYRRPRVLAFAAAIAVAAVAGIVTSQGRAVIVCAFVVLLAYGLFTVMSRGRVAGLLGVVAAAVVAVLVAQAIMGGGGGRQQAFRYSGLTTSGIVGTTGAARGKSFAKIPATLAHHPLGAGLAVAGPASGTAGGPELTGSIDAENELSFMTVETGVPGALLVVAFTAALLILGLLRVRREPDPEARMLLAAVLSPVAGMLALYIPSAVTATTPGGPYLWAAAGIVAYWLVARPRALAQGRAA